MYGCERVAGDQVMSTRGSRHGKHFAVVKLAAKCSLTFQRQILESLGKNCRERIKANFLNDHRLEIAAV